MGWNIALPAAEYFTPESQGLDGLIRQINDTQNLAIDTETDGLNLHKCRPYYWSLSWEEANGKDRRITMPWTTLKYFKRSFDDYNKKWVLANAKFDCHMLENIGSPLKGELIDVAVMHALLYEEESHGLKDMARSLLGWKWTDFTDTFGSLKSRTCICGGTEASHFNKTGVCKKTGCGNFVQTNPLYLLRKAEKENINLLVDYAANDAYGTWHVFKKLEKELEAAQTFSLYGTQYPYIKNMKDYFYKTEVPFTRCLYICERNGLKVDKEYLTNLGPKVLIEMQEIRFKINSASGRILNPKSKDQLIQYFCTEHGIRPRKLTSGGKSGNKKPSMDEKFLEWVRDEYYGEVIGEVAGLISEHEKIQKQYGTYIEKMPGRLDQHDRVHMRLNQDVARTGRLSCVAGWTKIATQRGVLAISDVVAGDYVWTHKQRQRRVLASFTKGVDHMYDVHLCNGQILTCTTSHRLLNAKGEWVKLGEILDEHFEGVGELSNEPGTGTNALQVQSTSNNAGHRAGSSDNYAQRGTHSEDAHARSGAQGTSQGSVFCLKDRGQESNAGEEGRAPPALDWGMRGRVWLPNLPSQRASDVCTSRSRAEGLGPNQVTKGPGGASHRHQPQEQPAGQPGTGHQERSSGYPLFTGEGLPAVEIKEVHYRGSLEVHDVTIEEDESYEACGVFSHNSSDPNMQNVTGGEKDRFKLRNAFIAEKDHSLVVADYSALEMRLLAAGSEEQAMMDIFHRNWDIHMGNASLVFEIPYDDLVKAKKTDKLVKDGKLGPEAMTEYVLYCLKARGDAKTIGFGLNYGMKEKTLARRMGCTEAEAIVKIDKYMATYPAVRRFFESEARLAEECGYSFTLMGRRRHLPDMRAVQNYIRFRAQRQSSNFPIQGTAAEACKMAMIGLSEDYELRDKYGYRMCLQVHDEIVGECPDETVEICKGRVKEWMEHPFPTDIGVPLTVEIGSAKAWGLAK